MGCLSKSVICPTIKTNLGAGYVRLFFDPLFYLFFYIVRTVKFGYGSRVWGDGVCNSSYSQLSLRGNHEFTKSGHSLR